MRALGIDFGERRIGLALSDQDGRLAVPFKTLERQTDRRAIYTLADLVRREGVGRLVIGEPRGLDGRAGDSAERVRRFGEKLARVTGLPITFVDEALTTVEATELLRQSGQRRGDHDPRLDALAAKILLQEALDRREPA